ncbi:MAG: alkaline shock response membrane anchor protein AmaP [Candidatus Omnitrophica bacterium]|nr:alkaline shock response membrane anchor protein AmaP [Candidatus Omnitrophota bacterium]MDE2215331.1 alkaline shock response membrane anchor protein AmaP [Candidatus Omnitrophota bacterium]MDE2231717.1 alkaline shock response membrane anchor protein AmaP [Candidatus Omnitrophota bacterium]
MWLLVRIALLFYLAIIWTASIAIILFAGHALRLHTIQQLLLLIYNDQQSAVVAGVVAGVIMLMSLLLAKLIYGRRQKERTLAFENPSGGVTVSLTALEDLIRRLIVQMPELKDIRPHMTAHRKGLEVDIKLVLRHEADIPELTSRFQELVRRKIEDSVGMEGKVNIRVHVIKISLDDIKSRSRDDFQVPVQTPFHGYSS